MFPSLWADPLELFASMSSCPSRTQYFHQSPLFEMTSDETTVTLFTNLPGFKQDEIDILFEQGKILTVTATKKDKRQLKREVVLPVKVDPDSTVAKLEDGVLSITFSKHRDTMPRKIAIS